MGADGLCPNCGVPNPAGNAYCNACGHALAAPAAALASAAPSPDRGAYVPERLAEKIRAARGALQGERKHVTVMFADVVGSTKLAERSGAEQWRQIMERFFAILCSGVHRFEGIIDRFTGDGVMAVFGAPIADEHHAAHACHAALDLCEELAGFSAELRREHGLNLLVRIGLHSGEVVVGSIGEEIDIKYTAVGHTVALAKRMEGLAEPGKVYLTEGTAAEVRGYFDLRDLGEFAVKGAEEPVRVYELAGLGRLRTSLELARAQGFSRFVGRQDEMRALDSALAHVRADAGQVVCVVGEAGIGKSRLLYEFAERCRKDRVEVWEGHCRARGETLALMPLLELLRSYFRIGERDPASSARDKVAARALLLDTALRDELPLLFDLLGISDPGTRGPRIDPEARQRRLFATINRILALRSERSAIVLVFEDLQWIDPGSAAFLENLVDALPHTRTLLLASFRPGYQAEWMGRSFTSRVALAPLDPALSQELATDLVGVDPSLGDLAQRIGERAGGNPFFIEELGREFVTDGSLVGDRRAYRLMRDVDQKAIPTTVQAVIEARIDRLGEREKQLLHAASVIGREFPEPVLTKVAGISEPEARVVLRDLMGSELIAERAISPEARYAFSHQLIEDVAYRSQLTDARARLHAHTAGALEQLYPERLDDLAALISQHYEQAGESLAAARWGARAAQWAGSANPTGAIRQWRRAIELSDAVQDMPEAVAIGIWSRIAIMDFYSRFAANAPEIKVAFEQARELAERSGDTRSLAMVVGMYAYTRTLAGEPAAYVDMHLESVRLAEEAGDPAMQVAMTGAPLTLFVTGRWREALEIMAPAFELWAEDPTLGTGITGESPYTAYVYLRALIRLYRGDINVQEALAENERALAGALERGDVEAACLVYTAQVGVCYLAGDDRAALPFANRAVELAERIGSFAIAPALKVHSGGPGTMRSTSKRTSRCRPQHSRTGSPRARRFSTANKRLALVAMLTFLEVNGLRVEASDPTLAAWILSLSAGATPNSSPSSCGRTFVLLTAKAGVPSASRPWASAGRAARLSACEWEENPTTVSAVLDSAGRRRSPASTPAVRPVTRACSTHPIHRPSRRSSA